MNSRTYPNFKILKFKIYKAYNFETKAHIPRNIYRVNVWRTQKKIFLMQTGTLRILEAVRFWGEARMLYCLRSISEQI